MSGRRPTDMFGSGESEDRYAALFDLAPVPLVALDRDGILKETNRAAVRLLGGDRAGLVGRPFSAGVVEGDRPAFADHLRACRQVEGAVDTELSLAGEAGAVVRVRLSSRGVAAEAGGDLHVVTTIVDLTEHRSAEEARAERERASEEELAVRTAREVRDRFLAMMGHELRTPLTPILFALRSLQDQGVVPEAMQPAVEMIRRNVELEARLVDDLLGATQVVQQRVFVQPARLDLHDLLTDVMALCATDLEAAGIDAVTELTAPNHHVWADPLRMREVFWTLVDNAVRNTRPGGRIVVRSAATGSGAVKVVVQDTGAGMDPERMARLFLPFEPAAVRRIFRKGDLGLGVPICKAVVDAHDGRIVAFSDGPGKGSTFEVHLPTVDALAGTARGRLRVPESGRAPTLLVVEDDVDTAEALRELLRLQGYEVRLARSAANALRQLDHTVDLVVSDVGLPDRSGLELMRELRKRRDVPGIALSGYGTSDDERRTLEAGFQRHLTKPIDFAILLEAIESLLGAAPRASRE